MKAITLIGMIFLLVSCASKQANTDGSSQPKGDLLKKYEQGMKYLEDEKYPAAAKIFNQLLVEHPASEFDLISIYNSGAAYEGMGNCLEASKRYRQAAQASVGKFRRIEVQSLLRLSYAYECLGEDTKVIATLLDVRQKKGILAEEVMKTEVPSRLAAAYARGGNRDVAEKYFKEASIGIRNVEIKTRGQIKGAELMAQTLYLMGRFNNKDFQPYSDSAAFILSLRYLQTYLLQAVEMNVQPWSGKAANEIVMGYDYVLKSISAPLEDGADPVKRRENIERRRQTIQEALLSLRVLRATQFPGRTPPSTVRMISALGEKEARFKSLLAEMSVSNELTSEAEKRESLKREGRVTTSKKTSLETKGKKP